MNRKARPRSFVAVRQLPNRELAELIAVLETDLLHKIGRAQHPDHILRYRLASIRRVVTPLRQLQWCYTELLHRADVGLLDDGRRKESRE
jgi:hypothetical protein